MRARRQWLEACPGSPRRFGPRSCVETQPCVRRKPDSCFVPPTRGVRLRWLQSEIRPLVEARPRCCISSHSHHKQFQSGLQRSLSDTNRPSHLRHCEPISLWKASQAQEGTSCRVDRQGPGTRGSHLVSTPPPLSGAHLERALGAPTQLSCRTLLCSLHQVWRLLRCRGSRARLRSAKPQCLDAARGTLDTAPRGSAPCGMGCVARCTAVRTGFAPGGAGDRREASAPRGAGSPEPGACPACSANHTHRR